jgi:peptide-methionine (R)-S-oxide reductase
MLQGCARQTVVTDAEIALKGAMHDLSVDEIPKTDGEWREFLSPEQYYVLREQGTELPFTSPLNEEKRKGTYVSADCGEALFRSEQKYDSGTGWPSFWAPIGPDVLELKTDTLLGYERTEVITKKCGGHLGHVFDDGPPPTGLRYCMNGLALKFIPDADQSSSAP